MPWWTWFPRTCFTPKCVRVSFFSGFHASLFISGCRCVQIFKIIFFFVLQTRNGMPLSPSTWVVLMILEVQGSLLLPCPFSFLLQGGALLNKEKCLHSPSPVLASLQRAFTWMCYLPLLQKNSCGSAYPSPPLTEENAEVQIS